MLVAFLWALCYPLIALGLTDAPPLLLAALRASAAGALLILIGTLLGRPHPYGWGQWLGLAVIGLGTASLGFGGMFLAGGRISPGLATVLSSTQPLLAAVLGVFALHERLSPGRLAALASGFAGVGLIAWRGLASDGAGTLPAGIAFVLMAAVGVAAGNVLLKRFAGRIDTLIGLGWQFALGSLPLWAAARIFGIHEAIHWDTSLVLAYAAMVLLGTIAPAVLWFLLLERNELVRMNAFTFLTPVFALLIGALAFDERLTGLQWAGTALVMGAVVLAARSPMEARTPVLARRSLGTPRAGRWRRR